VCECIASPNAEFLLQYGVMFGKKQVLVIAGPTGSGETTFTNELIDGFENFTHLVSATTRPPRLNEENGKDYYFFSKEEFFDEVEKGNIIEHTHVKNRDAYYGSYKPDLDAKIAKGLIVIANTDVKGAAFYREHYGATTIFICPKSQDVIEDRLRRRDPDIAEEEVERRLKSAQKEIDEAKDKYDYVVWNTDGEFANTVIDVVEILKKEGYKV
jgi:guanylate kinase